MNRIGICFAAPDAKQIGLLALLLEHHGVSVEMLCAEGSPAPIQDADLVLVAVSARARLSKAFVCCIDQVSAAGSRARALVIDDTDPAQVDPSLERLSRYDLSAEGVRALLQNEFELPFLPRGQVKSFQEKRAGEDERRTWNVQRFRYGLWLAFTRSTGAGKFDPYPLTHSKRLKTVEALLPEVERYSYIEVESGNNVEVEQVLSEALDGVWSDPEDMIPNAVHVVEATADHIWSRYGPTMLDRPKTA